MTDAGCGRNDICQKLGNNGGKPISGTVKCKHCVGARKCQHWPGVGTGLTCGCTVFGLSQVSSEIKKEDEAPAEAALAQADEAETEESDWGIASVCMTDAGCSRNDICQKLGNNGGKPFTVP